MPLIIKPLMSVKGRRGRRMELEEEEDGLKRLRPVGPLTASPAVSCDQLGTVVTALQQLGPTDPGTAAWLG